MELCVKNCTQAGFSFYQAHFRHESKEKEKAHTSFFFFFDLIIIKEKLIFIFSIYWSPDVIPTGIGRGNLTTITPKNTQSRAQLCKCPSVGRPEPQYGGRQTSLKIIIIKHHWRTPSAEKNGRIVPNSSVSRFHLVSNNVVSQRHRCPGWHLPASVFTHSPSLAESLSPSLSPNM